MDLFKSLRLVGYFVAACSLLSACAPYNHWPYPDYAFPVDTQEGLLIMSVTVDPKVETYGPAYAIGLGIDDLTPPSSNRRKYDYGYLGLVRSNTKPERFGLISAPFGGRTRDDLIIAKLPPGQYAVSYIVLNRGNVYWLQPFRDKKYYFKITPAKATYVGNFDITVDENKEEKKMRFEVQIQNLSNVDVPLFHETMKNVPREAVIVDLLTNRAADAS